MLSVLDAHKWEPDFIVKRHFICSWILKEYYVKIRKYYLKKGTDFKDTSLMNKLSFEYSHTQFLI